MATLDAKKRASLPNSAFAYVDSKGNRRLPINDETHVRNALARFNQVRYESEQAREKAFRKLLKAAGVYGIAPVGFVSRELQRVRSDEPAALPGGVVTLLLTDIEGSTALVQGLGDAYPGLLEQVRGIIRTAVGQREGFEVDARADEFFAAFASAVDALKTAIEIQKSIDIVSWRDAATVRVRIGLHSGSPALTDTGYVGLPVHVMARVASAGHGGQILTSTATSDEVADSLPRGVRLRSLGVFALHGLPEPEELFQVEAEGLQLEFPPLRVTNQA